MAEPTLGERREQTVRVHMESENDHERVYFDSATVLRQLTAP